MTTKAGPYPNQVLADQLRSLAFNLWWVWNPEAQDLFKELSPSVWERSNHNPIAVLKQFSMQELNVRLHDVDYAAKVQQVLNKFYDYSTQRDTWAREHAAELKQQVAYFSAEFGLHESLPIYSGGLGVLSGDHAKSASDLGIPFVGIGLLYQQGYFQQRVGPDGWQQEYYPYFRPEDLPLDLLTLPEGGRLLNSVEIGHSIVYFQTWRLQVGRVHVYLLDTNVPENDQHFQWLTARVYGGDIDTRIGQEIILGIGGVRLLKSLGIEPNVYHMNEGHSAFLVLELLSEELKSGKSKEQAERTVSQKCVFTTHTPVAAGHDSFNSELIQHALGKFWSETKLDHKDLMAYGRINPSDDREPFTMTVLALKMSRATNGVSQLHGSVSRNMWKALYPEKKVEQVPIGFVTNGIHTPSWATPRAHEFWDKRLGSDWTGRLMEPNFWHRIEEDQLATDEELWAFRYALRRDLTEFVRQRLRDDRIRFDVEAPTHFEQILSPDALTICFARRFATYKRALLLFRHLDKTLPLLTDPNKPVQIIYAGKAHPRDNEGKRFLQQIVELTRHPQLYGKVVFIENYDLNVARHMVAGADVWLNTPRRPLEASGTSGQKVAIHGGLNLSILDGWWCEGCDGSNGWAIGDDTPQSDPEAQDEKDFNGLCQVLQEQVIPEFYDRGEDGIPRKWIARIRHAMKSLIPVYNTDRMVAEYVRKYYISKDD